MKKNNVKLILGAILIVSFVWFLGSGPAQSASGQEEAISEDDVRPQHVRPAFWWWNPKTLLIGVGDSLTQGTRDATNNKTNTENGYLQLVYEKLEEKRRLKFSQPFLNENENRINPFTIPTNLGVDGEDIFSVEGIEYAGRDGKADENYESDENFCNRLQPYLFADMHDKVLYPINLWAGKKVSQMDALIWHLNNRWGKPAWIISWIGNNDAALASLGLGGKNPQYIPIPFEQIKHKLKWGVRFLLSLGKATGVLSFKPYTEDTINQNLTTVDDFSGQFGHLQSRLNGEANMSNVKFFLLTLPYYTEVGYLMDSSGLEFYLQKLDGSYVVPSTFQNLNGRVSLLTFMSMYTLLKSDGGEAFNYLNDILGNDGLVLSEAERTTIKSRIDAFNGVIESAAGGNVHIIDIGPYLNGIFKDGTSVNSVQITRNWGQGNGFSMDGVHGSYTAHALIANYILTELEAPNHDLNSILMKDPYIDWDKDGWVKGPDYKASGRTKILFLFKDENDNNENIGAKIEDMGADKVWELISDALLEEIIGIPLIKMQAERMGLVPIEEIKQ